MITRKTFGSPAGDIEYITLSNKSGASVTFTSVGAGVVALNVPDARGRLADVALGYADPADYLGDGPCSGKIPGRFANRIAGGLFSIDGHEYQLPVNLPPNCNHGGPEGFHNKIWNVDRVEEGLVVFSLLSPDGDSGFPGNLQVTATYEWSDDNALSLTLSARTDAPTVVNLTNHTYWNLGGHNCGTALGQTLKLEASHYLPTDSTLIPEGVLAPVAGSPMDFTEAKEIGRDIKLPFPALIYGKGYDNCWALDNYDGTVRLAATLCDPVSGRVLEVSTDQPGVQVYAGNWLAGCPANKDFRPYEDYDGIAIECQNFPNSPNTPAFPSAVLRPGETYQRHIIFKFSVR